MCYYFDDTIRIIDIDFDNILLDEKSYKAYIRKVFNLWHSVKDLHGCRAIAYLVRKNRWIC